ncbi:MAG TPA: phage portal protein [Advenella kashmirensis]|uniref:Phage portal protein n=1 Tax=Advenella kashmirensis TaxID=310575 RepID=A0A356LBP2_9BURK|nr:phage portal protein [Advenella kashmirensis]
MKKPGKIKSALINWLGQQLTLANPEFWNEFFGTSSSGKVVTVEKALQLSAVWACVRLISETVSTLPLKLYQKMPDGSRVPAKNHPLYKLLCIEPNKDQTPSEFLLFIVASLVLRGNAFVEKIMIGQKIIALIPIAPQYLTKIEKLKNGKYEYTIVKDGKERKIPEDRMFHTRAFGLDGRLGLDPIKYGAEVFGAAMAADEAAAKIFENGLQNSGFLTHEKGYLKPEQREEIRKSLTQFMGSKNSGKTMVLEAGLMYHGVSMNPEAAQMLETRGYGVEEICRWFRVPPFMVGHTDKQSSWASSVEGMNLQFLTTCLNPLLRNIEDSIFKRLINPYDRDEYYAEFSVEGLLRADSKGRAEFYSSGLDHGWINRNEVRSRENLPPMDGGEVFTVQSALIPLDKIGTNYERKTTQSADSAN